jgi:hypothetical protein
LLVSKLDEMLADLMGQRVLLLADQASTDDEAWLSLEKVATGTSEETRASEGTSAQASDSASATAFKRRLAKLDRKIEFVRRSIDEHDVVPSSMAMLEADREPLHEELAAVSARVKSLDDAIWACAWKLEHMPVRVAMHLQAEAPKSDNE